MKRDRISDFFDWLFFYYHQPASSSEDAIDPGTCRVCGATDVWGDRRIFERCYGPPRQAWWIRLLRWVTT
jgi:hypothetical protein